MHRKCEKADSDKLALKRTLQHCKQAVTKQLLKRATLLFHIHTAVFTLGKTYKLPPRMAKYLLSQPLEGVCLCVSDFLSDAGAQLMWNTPNKMRSKFNTHSSCLTHNSKSLWGFFCYNKRRQGRRGEGWEFIPIFISDITPSIQNYTYSLLSLSFHVFGLYLYFFF